METGLAFSGGGIPGCAAVGVLMALKEAGITVTHITGASSGAMVAALYAYGYDPEELTNIVPRLSRRYLDLDWRAILLKVLLVQPRVEGWLKGNRLRGLMEELTEKDTFSAMRIPCGIVATDLHQGKTVVFSQTPVDNYDWEGSALIADAVRASFAIPVLFRPMHYAGRILIDGGVLTNCPVQVCRTMGAKHVIAVDPITPIANTTSNSFGSYQLVHKLIYLNLRKQMELEHQHAAFVIYPQTGSVGVFEFRKALHCIEAGYKATVEKIDEIKAVLAEQERLSLAKTEKNKRKGEVPVFTSMEKKKVLH